MGKLHIAWGVTIPLVFASSYKHEMSNTKHSMGKWNLAYQARGPASEVFSLIKTGPKAGSRRILNEDMSRVLGTLYTN